MRQEEAWPPARELFYSRLALVCSLGLLAGLLAFLHAVLSAYAALGLALCGMGLAGLGWTVCLRIREDGLLAYLPKHTRKALTETYAPTALCMTVLWSS
jgi:hypothetical protein